VFDVSALPDGRVQVVVLNGGPADLANEFLIVTVRNLGGVGETLTFAGILPAGATITFLTSSFTIGDGLEEVQVVLDPSSSLDDPNRANNVLTSTLSRVPMTTPTPPGSGPG
jgi:hypothetical protein